MSKSKNNIVDPDDIIATYGADTARWFMLSDSPPDRDVIWTEERVQGAARFVQRLWRLVDESPRSGMAPAVRPASIGAAAWRCARPPMARWTRCRSGIERLHFNVCLAHIRELTNALGDMLRPEAAPPDIAWALREAADRAGSLVSPMMPHLAEECWQVLGGSAPARPWPKIERALLVEDTMTLLVQVNGRKRAGVTVARRPRSRKLRVPFWRSMR